VKIAVLETDIVDIAKKIKTGLQEAEGDAVKLASFLENNSGEIEALAAVAGPAAAGATDVGLGLLNTAIIAVKASGDAASANGISVSFDAAAVAKIKAVVTAVEKVKL
jgi:hypothetical protein